MKIFRMFLFTTCMVSLVSLVSAQELLIHKTKDGDTLWDISEKYLQTPWLWMAIADYNKLKNPHFILPGDMIKIPEVPQVKVTEVFGDVTIKRIGTNKYVNLRRGDNVYPHDEVVVGPDSTAQIEFEDKSILQLKPETSLVLKHSVYAEKVKAVNTKVKLLHGKMSFKGTKTTGSNFEIETPGVFCGVRGTEFEIGYTPDGLSSISVFQGEVLASSTGKAVNVPAGFGIQSVKGELPSPPKPLPKSPELIKPVDDFITGILTLTFSWKSVPEAAKYYLEIAKDEAFNNVVYRVQGTESTSVVSTTLPVGKYYWRVRSIDKSGLEGKFSNARILRIVRKLQLEIVPDSPLFKKESILYAHISCQYTLKPLDADTSIVRIIAAIDNDDFYTYHQPISFNKAGTHTIKYKGVDAFGNSGEIDKFIVVVDNIPPEVQIDIDHKSGSFVHPQTIFSLAASDNAAGVAEVQCKIDNEEWKRYTGAFSISQEGNHQIGFRAVDTVGNQSMEKMVDVIVDRTPPEVQMDIDRKSGNFVHPQTKFSLIASDNAAGVAEVQCKIDNEEWKRYTGAFSISQEGSHQIGFRAVDTVGNQSKEKVIDVIVDHTPPEIKIDIDRKSGNFVHPQTKFSLIASDNAAGVAEVQCKIDNEEWKRYTGAFSISQEGSHQIGFRAVDTVGNQSKEKVIDVIVDHTPPEIKIDIDRKSGCFVHPQTKFSLIASDSAAGVAEVQCKIDNEEWKRYTGAFSIVQEGIHQIGFRAVDTLGNQSKEKIIDVIVDRTPPEVQMDIDRKSGSFVHPQTIFSLAASDSTAGVAEVLYKIDDKEWKKYTGAFSILQEGSHQIGFQAIDTVGNQSKENVLDIIVDNTPPEVKIDIDRKSGNFVHPQTKFSLIASDNAAGVAEVQCKIDNEEWKRYTGTFSILQEGSHQIGFRAIDTVGNQSKEKVIDVIVDNTPPEIKIDIDRKSGCFVHPQTKFSLIASDNAAGVAEVQCKIDNEEWKRYTGAFSIVQEGIHQIGFRAIDTVGNQSKEKTIDVIVDNTPPDVQMDIDRKSGSFVRSDTQFSLIGIDDAAGVAEVIVKIDNEAWMRYAGTFSIFQEGSHWIRFQAIDNVGNQSKEKIVNVIVDRTPPGIKMDIDHKSGCFVRSDTKFSLIASDDASGVAEFIVKIDNEAWKNYSGTFSLSQEGNHQIGFQAMDTLGNQSKEKIIDVIVDNTAPEVQMDIDRKSGSFVHPQTKFSLIASDNASGVDEVLYRLDNKEWKRYTDTFSISQEGIHQIEFRAIDSLGNQSKEQVTNVIVDQTPPVVKMDIDRKFGSFVHPQTGFSLTAIDELAGVAEVLCKIDNEEWKKYPGTFSISQEGGHRIGFQAIDNVGNPSKEQIIDVIVDSTPPEVQMDIDRKSGCFVHSQTKFSLLSRDDASGVMEVLFRIDNDEWKRYNAAFSIALEGSHQIEFRVADNIGNQSKEKVVNVIVDNTPPEIKIEIDRKSGCFVHPHTRFSIITSDNASGVAEVLCKIDDEEWKKYDATFSIAQEGRHKIRISAIDT
ncbi:MAG: Ig-like domain-containing protein, partial [bacterium]